MLTRLIIRNFKRFGQIEIELGEAVVRIGPNNSGKTSALQALALWELGLRRWNEKRGGRGAPEERPGVAINRRDLISVPVPSANLLWRDLHVRDVCEVDGKRRTQNIRIDIVLEGAGRDVVIAFVGAPHRIADRASQVFKALRDIAFAHYVANRPTAARDHFYGLREARPDLIGIALFDRIAETLRADAPLEELMWRRRELENYVALPEVLDAYAAASAEVDIPGPLCCRGRDKRRALMRECIADLVPPIALRDRSDSWWSDTKASDDFLDRLFETYFPPVWAAEPDAQDRLPCAGPPRPG
jgi:hypothetical protein